MVFAFVLLLAIGLIFGDHKAEQKIHESNASTLSNTQPVEVAPANKNVEVISINQTIEPETSNLTGPQKNAVRSAEQYLNMSGFSREGLIQQLSSSYGSGYEIADATAAVDSLNVDWSEQAVRSAKQYLEMTGFSCNGLIEQLSSSAGSSYTLDQATYGAKQAGACS